jgi:hypothetical protein
VSNPPQWVRSSKLATSYGELNMPGIAAGVVSAADVNTPMPATGSSRFSLDNPATWSYIWTAAAAVYLIGIYIGSIRIARSA